MRYHTFIDVEVELRPALVRGAAAAGLAELQNGAVSDDFELSKGLAVLLFSPMPIYGGDEDVTPAICRFVVQPDAEPALVERFPETSSV